MQQSHANNGKLFVFSQEIVSKQARKLAISVVKVVKKMLPCTNDLCLYHMPSY